MDMVNAFLIIVAMILIGCTVLGGIKGFVHTVFTMFFLFIVIILTGLLSPYVADYVNGHTDVPNKIRNELEQKLNLKEKIKYDSGAVGAEELLKAVEIPDQLKDIIIEKNKQVSGLAKATTDSLKEKYVSDLYDRITELIVSAIAYLFTFAVVGVIVLIAGILLDIVAKLPGIRQANTVLGAIMGFVQGYLIVTLLYIAALAFAATGLGESVIQQVSENEILTWFYDHNFVIEIVFGMLK